MSLGLGIYKMKLVGLCYYLFITGK